MYRGLGIGKNFSEGFKWLKKAAEQGNAAAQMNIAWMYQNGFGVEKDYTEAIKWFQKVSDQELSDTQSHPALLHKRMLKMRNSEAYSFLITISRITCELSILFSGTDLLK